jgi:hypothetical protein
MGSAENALRKYREAKAWRLARSIAKRKRQGLGAVLALSLAEHPQPFLFDEDIFREPSLVEVLSGGGYVAVAEEIIRHRFDILGSGTIDISLDAAGIAGDRSPQDPEPYRRIDWHRDFKSGIRWEPDILFTRVQYSLGNGSDIQVPWKLSRFHHLPVLGVAYRLTGDERYARESRHQVEDWIGANPPLYGVNWIAPMEAAIRAVNWIWCYQLLSGSPSLDGAFLAAFAESLYVHGKYIRSNLERPPWLVALLQPLRPLLENKLGYGTTDDVLRGLRTNHFLCDLVGLLYIGSLLSATGEGRRWRDLAAGKLAAEMETLVYPDGVQYEGSLCYHRLTAEAFLSATLLCLRGGQSFPAWYMERLEKMVEFTRHYTRPDGLAPQVGDNGDTRIHILEGYGRAHASDNRHLLSIGGALFSRPELAEDAGGFRAEALLLAGAPSGTPLRPSPRWSAATGNAGESPPPAYGKEASGGGGKPDGAAARCPPGGAPASRGFPRGGYYIMREGGLYMIVDCIPDDPRAPSGHRHNSRLSFELFAWDRSLVVDPGVYVYNADAEMRNAFRSTRYHNTVVVDGREQNDFPGENLFNMGRGASVRVNRWEVGEDRDFLDAEHHGYRRLAGPVVHRRQILFLKREGYWLIRDVLEGKDTHRFDLYFHLAPMPVEPADGFPLAVRTRGPGTDLAILPLRAEGLKVEIEEGWVSPSYGVRERAPVVRYRGECGLPADIVNVLYPFRGEIDIGEVAAQAAEIADRL